MTATDELRRMLDERGVEWSDEAPYQTTWTGAMGEHCSAMEWSPTLTVLHANITSEQAIAATLDGGYQGFWTHDGTLHIELPKLPESILVCLPDKRDREVRSARVWQYTLGDADATPTRQGVGTCHNTWDVELTGRLRFQCSECKGVSLEITPNFCPCCGRKVVDE